MKSIKYTRINAIIQFVGLVYWEGERGWQWLGEAYFAGKNCSNF